MSLGFPFSVRSVNFCFFLARERGEGLCFCCVFDPLSREGNFRLHSTRFNYSSSYGSRVGSLCGACRVCAERGARRGQFFPSPGLNLSRN